MYYKSENTNDTRDIRESGEQRIPGSADDTQNAAGDTQLPSDPPPPDEKGSSQQVKYPIWVDMLAIIGVLIAASFVGGMLKLLIERTTGADPDFGTFISYIVTFSITIGFAAWQRIRRGQNRPILRFSLKKTNPTLVLWGFILVLVTSVVLEPLLSLFPDEYMELLGSAIGTGGWAMLTTIVAAPILEEILFRGLIQEAVVREYGGVRGVLAAAAIFGIIHIIPQQAINAFFIGIILGYIYIKTKSLLPVILIHAINNAIAFILMLIFGDKVVVTKELIGNDIIYWIVYALCVLIFIVACFNVGNQISKVTGRRQE